MNNFNWPLTVLQDCLKEVGLEQVCMLCWVWWCARVLQGRRAYGCSMLTVLPTAADAGRHTPLPGQRGVRRPTKVRESHCSCVSVACLLCSGL